MANTQLPQLLVASDESIDLSNPSTLEKGKQVSRHFTVADAPVAPLRISAEFRCDGVTGPPCYHCCALFNLTYTEGPVFWDTFLYPETGSTSWQPLYIDVRARGQLAAVEMKVQHWAKGRLRIRNVRVEAIEPWTEDADLSVAVFGDSTDMTSNCPREHRLSRRLELLLRDRFQEHRIDVHGLAEGGEFLQRVIESGRLARELDALPACDIAMIRYGLNDHDHGITPEAFYGQLHEACDIIAARYPDAQIVLSTTIPAYHDGFCRQAETVAAERELPLIPLRQYILDRSAAGDWDWHHDPQHRVGQRQTECPPDNPTGLDGDKHPNYYGAQLIAEYYYQHLEPIAEQKLMGALPPSPPPGI